MYECIEHYDEVPEDDDDADEGVATVSMVDVPCRVKFALIRRTESELAGPRWFLHIPPHQHHAQEMVDPDAFSAEERRFVYNEMMRMGLSFTKLRQRWRTMAETKIEEARSSPSTLASQTLLRQAQRALRQLKVPERGDAEAQAEEAAGAEGALNAKSKRNPSSLLRKLFDTTRKRIHAEFKNLDDGGFLSTVSVVLVLVSTGCVLGTSADAFTFVCHLCAGY